MTSLTDPADPVDLREVVDVVIGVDTHVHTHTAAVIDARTGGVLDQLTVTADRAGYAELVELAEHHTPLRAWAIEQGRGLDGRSLLDQRWSPSIRSSAPPSVEPVEIYGGRTLAVERAFE